MKDKNFFKNVSENLCNALPDHLQQMKKDIEKNFHIILQNAFNKLDLVTREEFDAQTKVLARSRSKIENLEAQVKKLENQIKKKQNS